MTTAQLSDTEDFDSIPLVDNNKVESIISLADGDIEFLRELLRLFTDRSPTLIEDMSSALHENNLVKLEHSAHALKGTAGNLGAFRMMRLCERVEFNSKDGKISDSSVIISKLRDIYPETHELISKKLIRN